MSGAGRVETPSAPWTVIRAPGAKAPIRDLARANANPATKIVDRKVKVVWEPTGDRAREKAKVEATVRVKDAGRGKAAVGRPKCYQSVILSRLQHWEAA